MSMSNTEKRVKQIRRKTRRNFSSEKKIHIVLGGLQWVVSGDSRQSEDGFRYQAISGINSIPNFRSN